MLLAFTNGIAGGGAGFHAEYSWLTCVGIADARSCEAWLAAEGAWKAAPHRWEVRKGALNVNAWKKDPGVLIKIGRGGSFFFWRFRAAGWGNDSSQRIWKNPQAIQTHRNRE